MLSKIPKWILIGIIILASCAGFINSIVLLGFEHFPVSHVTGTVSLFANSLISGDLSIIKITGLIITSFFLGAVFSGSLIQGRSLYFGRRYGLALVIESCCLFTVTIIYAKVPFFSVLLASFACGLQNALVTTYSNSLIRTTHLTGIMTDLGAALGSFITGKKINIIQIKLHLSILSSFFIGAVTGGFVHKYLNHFSFLIPATIISIAGSLYTVLSSLNKKKIAGK